jgi:hypothetical protein
MLHHSDFDLRMTEVGSEASADFGLQFSTDVIITFWLQRDNVNGSDFRVEIVNGNTGMLIFYLAIGTEIKIGKQG